MKKPTSINKTPLQLFRAIPKVFIPQANPIDGLLSREKLDQSITLRFSVWDEATTGHSYSLTGNGINHPHDLMAPVVPQAANGMIEYDDPRHGVEVRITHYGNAQARDVIVLSWGGIARPGQVLSESTAAKEVALSMNVSFGTVQAAGDGANKVLYEVHRDGDLRATSPARAVNVFDTLPGPHDPTPATLINEQLFVDADATKTLRLSVIAEGTSLCVKPYRNMHIGHQTQLLLKGFDAFIDREVIVAPALNSVIEVDEAQSIGDIAFDIPKDFQYYFQSAA